GPHLRTIEYPAVAIERCPRSNAGKIRPGVGLTHTDAEEDFTATDSWQKFGPLLLGSKLHQQWAALPIANPVRCNWRACDQKLFNQHKAREGVSAGAAVSLWQRQAEPPALR